MIVSWLSLSCSPQIPPELRQSADAIAAWELGQERLSAGDPDAALAHFERASTHRPSPLLDAWRARALADKGDLPGAIAVLDRVLAARPTFAEARYNRAAYKARAGQLSEAAKDLQLALVDGASKPLLVLDDPDFAPHLDLPDFAFLPREALVLTVQAPPPTAFWGSELALGITAAGLLRSHLEIESASGTGPVELVGVTEETIEEAHGTQTELRYRFRAVGAGRVVLGPITLRAGTARASTEEILVEITAPPDKAPIAPTALSFPLPSALVAAVPLGAAAFIDGALVVHAAPGERVVTEPSLGSAARCEVHRGDLILDGVFRYPPGMVVNRIHILSVDGSLRDVEASR